jgi:hypothetical protein
LRGTSWARAVVAMSDTAATTASVRNDISAAP